MSNFTYLTRYTRLSDALERELMLAAISREQPISLRDACKGIVSAIRHGAVAMFNYATALGEALSQARAKDPHNQYSL